MTDELAMVAAFTHRYEADAARGMLEDAGIRAMVSADDAGGAYPGLVLDPNPARVCVAAPDADRARELLGDFEPGSVVDEATGPEGDPGKPGEREE